MAAFYSCSNCILTLLTTSSPNDLLVYVLLPFLLIFTVIWGLLGMTKIFGTTPDSRKINIILAVVITIFAAFTDAWGIIATNLAAFTGQFAYVTFIVIFIAMVIMWAINRGRSAYEGVDWNKRSGDLNDLKELDKQIAKVLKKYNDARDRGDAAKEAVLGDTLRMLSERKKKMHEAAEWKYKSTY